MYRILRLRSCSALFLRHGDQKAMAESKRIFNLVGGFKHGFYFPIFPFHKNGMSSETHFSELHHNYQDGMLKPPTSKAQRKALLGLWQSPRRIMTNPGHQHTARRQRCCTRMVRTRVVAWCCGTRLAGCWMADIPPAFQPLRLRE